MICEAHYDCSECSESQREAVATAHAAAIQAAAAIGDELYGLDEYADAMVERFEKKIRRLTPADAQRCYDLRIAEARLDEATAWDAHSNPVRCFRDEFAERFASWSIKRFTELSAEVQRLKTLIAE